MNVDSSQRVMTVSVPLLLEYQRQRPGCTSLDGCNAALKGLLSSVSQRQQDKNVSKQQCSVQMECVSNVVDMGAAVAQSLPFGLVSGVCCFTTEACTKSSSIGHSLLSGYTSLLQSSRSSGSSVRSFSASSSSYMPRAAAAGRAHRRRASSYDDDSEHDDKAQQGGYGNCNDKRRRKQSSSYLTDMTHPASWYPLARAVKREVVAHLGPTNSGKTYAALAALKEAKNGGVYCGPLRLLAFEVGVSFAS